MSPVQAEVMEDVCCPANSVAISIPVISSSFRYLPPYTCTPEPPSVSIHSTKFAVLLAEMNLC